ncbi:MAG: type II toxin-antitoxin system PemK/MazF family toxin [Pyrinomonadaceae bacterium]|nr:type II toxin-antitoxin system PemK/MazF family toxin [Pyrinomonadaceae bacterium]
MAMVNRFEIYLFNLESDPSGEAKNTRPCVVVSPNEMNKHIESVIIAPISSANRDYPTRVGFDFLDKKRAVVLDQLRTVEKDRLVKRIGEIKGITREKVLSVLQELFAQ